MRSSVELPWGTVSYLHWTPVGEPKRTVLLLHGGGVDNAALSWGEFGPALAADGYRVVAPDHPGYGCTPLPDWRATQARLVDYVAEFVDALDLRDYAVGGLSLGGGMAIGHVLDRPAAAVGLCLFASYGFTDRLPGGPAQQSAVAGLLRLGVFGPLSRWLSGNRRVVSASMGTLIRNRDRITGELLGEVLVAGRQPSAYVAFSQWQRSEVGWRRLRTCYLDRLPDIGIPTVIVHGSEDPGVPVAAARTAAGLLPDGRLTVVPGAGHWVQRDAPAEVLGATLDFLGG